MPFKKRDRNEVQILKPRPFKFLPALQQTMVCQFNGWLKYPCIRKPEETLDGLKLTDFFATLKLY